MSASRTPSWRIPKGVSAGVWDYIQSEELAQNYDASLADSALALVDERFVQSLCEEGSRVLDMGCGTGRTVIALAQHGCWCVGVDLSISMLAQARIRMESLRLAFHGVCANLADLSGIADASFDRVVCLFNTLGMIEGAENRLSVMHHAYRLLRPSGLLLLHVHNRAFNWRHKRGIKWMLQSLLPGLGQSGWEMPAHLGSAGWRMHLFSAREIRVLAREAGFEIVAHHCVSIDGHEVRGFWRFSRAHGYLMALAKPACQPVNESTN